MERELRGEGTKMITHKPNMHPCIVVAGTEETDQKGIERNSFNRIETHASISLHGTHGRVRVSSNRKEPEKEEGNETAC